MWEGSSNELTKQGLIWFTDGSKTEKGVGTAAWRQGSGHKVVCNLDIQAEVRDIAECAQAMLEGYCRGMPVVICSDSQAVLGALDGYLVRSSEVLGYSGPIEVLARANSVSLLWDSGPGLFSATRFSVGLPV